MSCLVFLVFLAAGCQLGPRDDAPAHGPPLHVVATYPADGQGTNATRGTAPDCDLPTPDCPVPTNVAIELRFDRFLLPGGGLSAGLRVFTGETANSVAFSAEYDVIERVVVFRSAEALQPNTLYTAEVVPSKDVSRGFWAFDQAPLEQEGSVPLSFSFSTGSGPGNVLAAAAPVTDTCDSIASGPLSSCSNCHVTQPGEETIPASKYPPMGLDLSSASGFYYTAIEHVAHQAETGNTAANAGLEAPSRFGVQMNVVDPGLPATSYLLYKLLEKRENYRLVGGDQCLTGFHAPVSDGNCQPPSDDELVQLRDWFVRGDPMPKNPTAAPGATATVASLSHANLVQVARWIAAGAACPVPQ